MLIGKHIWFATIRDDGARIGATPIAAINRIATQMERTLPIPAGDATTNTDRRWNRLYFAAGGYCIALRDDTRLGIAPKAGNPQSEQNSGCMTLISREVSLLQNTPQCWEQNKKQPTNFPPFPVRFFGG
jgi:hypothetical protein